MISISIPLSDVLSARYKLTGIKNGSDRGMTRALNATAKVARTRAYREVRNDVRLTAEFVRTKIKGPNESVANRATFSNQVAKVTAQKRPLILSHFLNPNRTIVTLGENNRYSPVVEVKIKPTGNYQVLSRAFLILLKRGVERGTTYGIFIRKNGRLKHLYGPSVSQVMGTEAPRIMRELQTYLELVYAREVSNVLRQYR